MNDEEKTTMTENPQQPIETNSEKNSDNIEEQSKEPSQQQEEDGSKVSYETLESLNDNTGGSDAVVHIQTKDVVSIILFVIGAIFLIVSLYFLSNDLETSGGDQYQFNGKEYVGGDAYNYIISACRSTAIMVKSLVYAVIGCTSLLAGLINLKLK